MPYQFKAGDDIFTVVGTAQYRRLFKLGSVTGVTSIPSDLPESAEFMIDVLFDTNANRTRKKIVLYYYNNATQTVYSADMYGTSVVRQWVKWPIRDEITALNNRLGTLRYISVTNGGTFTITFRSGYACALIFGIINSKRYVILISPGNGTPIVEYVYRADESATINVTSVSATSLNITSDRGNDFVIAGEFLSVLRSE